MAEKSFDPYEILSLRRAATQKDVRRAFKTAAKKWHPDVEGGDIDRFKLISRAYEVLSNPKRRAWWDEFEEASLRVGFNPERARAAAQSSGAWSSGWGEPQPTPRAAPRSSPPSPTPGQTPSSGQPSPPPPETRDVRVHDDRPWWSGNRSDNGTFGATGAFGPKGPGSW